MDERFPTKKETLRVQGMICRACEAAVQDSLMCCRGVISVTASYWRGTADVEYDPQVLSREELEKRLSESGYPVGERGVSGAVVDALCVALVVFLVWFLLNNTLIKVPQLEAGAGLGYIFLIGLLTSTHCLGMCGGIILSQTTDASGLLQPGEKRSRRGAAASGAYNAGRVLSYTAAGAVFGALGSVISYTPDIKSMVFTIAGALVTVMGIGMWGILPFFRRLSPDLPGFCSIPGRARKSLCGKPLLIGLLTGLMPCGALYAMWLYAMSTGSALSGAAAMLAFTLGTVPLLFLFGALNSFLPKSWMKYTLKLSAVLVVALGVKMLIKGLLLAGLL